MRSVRLIARLDVKAPNLIKGVQLEGLRVIGSPAEHAMRYYEQGADELIYMDCVASLYGRNSLGDLVRDTAQNVFVPITVGGGIRSVDDATHLLRCGADKVAINTAAVADPALITDIARKFGSQCMVLSVEAKRMGPNRWEVLTDYGRQKTGLDVVAWVKRAVALGAGEVLVTSVDREGTRKGFDIPLVAALTSELSVPVVASGGMGTPQDLIDVVTHGRADAVAMADILHYGRATIGDVRHAARAAGLEVRHYEFA